MRYSGTAFWIKQLLFYQYLEMENSIMPLNGLSVRELFKGFERIDENFPLRPTLTWMWCFLKLACRSMAFRHNLFCLEMLVHFGKAGNYSFYLKLSTIAIFLGTVITILRNKSQRDLVDWDVVEINCVYSVFFKSLPSDPL